jgi:hypothetical protein
MKKYLYFAVVALFYSLLISCSADKAQPQSNNPIIDVVTQGTWKVTHYTDHGGNETMHFVDYTFTFRSDNTLVASAPNSLPKLGNWNLTDNNSSTLYTDLSTLTDDTPNDLVDFNIKFDGPADFNDIEDDWDVETISATEIVLKDGKFGDPTGIDFITFEKVPTPELDLSAYITQGKWKINYYSDGLNNQNQYKDQTANFEGYSFTFGANGSIVATNVITLTSVTGNWIITQNNESNLYTPPALHDDSIDKSDFNIYFPMTNLIFNDIEDDWDIVFVSTNTIILKDEVTSDPSLNDYIVFKKLP